MRKNLEVLTILLLEAWINSSMGAGPGNPVSLSRKKPITPEELQYVVENATHLAATYGWTIMNDEQKDYCLQEVPESITSLMRSLGGATAAQKSFLVRAAPGMVVHYFSPRELKKHRDDLLLGNPKTILLLEDASEEEIETAAETWPEDFLTSELSKRAKPEKLRELALAYPSAVFRSPALQLLEKEVLLEIARKNPVEALSRLPEKDLGKEDYRKLIDDNLEDALKLWSGSMTRKQRKLAKQLYPETALECLYEDEYTGDELAQAIDKWPGAAVGNYYDRMTPEQIDLACKQRPGRALAILADNLNEDQINYCVRNLDETVLYLKGLPLLPETKKWLIENNGEAALRSDVDLNETELEQLAKAHPLAALHSREYELGLLGIRTACVDLLGEAALTGLYLNEEEFKIAGSKWPETAKTTDPVRYRRYFQPYKITTREVPRDPRLETPINDDAGLVEASNPQTTTERLGELARSCDPRVAEAVASHPNTSPQALLLLSRNPWGAVQEAAVTNPNAPLYIVLEALSVKKGRSRVAGGRYWPKAKEVLKAKLRKAGTRVADIEIVSGALFEKIKNNWPENPGELLTMESQAKETASALKSLTPGERTVFKSLADKDIAKNFTELLALTKETCKQTGVADGMASSAASAMPIRKLTRKTQAPNPAAQATAGAVKTIRAAL